MTPTPGSWDDGMTVLRVLWRRRWLTLACALVCLASTAIFVSRQAPTYQATVYLLSVAPRARPQQADESFLLSDLTNLREARSRRAVQTLLDSQFMCREIHSSLPTELAKTFPDPTNLPLTVENPPGTELLRISARSTDKRAALALSDAVAHKAVEFTEAVKERASREAEAQIETELTRVRRQVGIAHDGLETFRAEHQVTDLAAELSDMTMQLAALRKDLVSTQVDFDSTRAELAAVVSESAREPAMVPGGTTALRSPLLELIPGQTYRPRGIDSTSATTADPGMSQVDRAASEAQSTEEVLSPSLVNAVQERPNPVLEDLRLRIARLRTDEANLSRRLESLRQAKREIEQRIDYLNEIEPEWARLFEAYTVLQQSYGAMVSNRETVAVSRTAQLPDVQILSEAELLPYPVSPRKALDLIAALVLGLLIGMIGALALERFAPVPPVVVAEVAEDPQ